MGEARPHGSTSQSSHHYRIEAHDFRSYCRQPQADAGGLGENYSRRRRHPCGRLCQRRPWHLCNVQCRPQNVLKRHSENLEAAGRACSGRQGERRRCQLMASKVNVGLVLMDMLSREDAVHYLTMVRVPVEVAVRVVGQSDKRRKSPPGAASARQSTSPAPPGEPNSYS